LIKNKYPPNDFDKRRIDFFRYKLPKITTPEEKIKGLSELLGDLKKFDPNEIEIETSWLKGKIQKRPLFDIVKEKSVKSK
jgi:hypothetical protein